MQSTLVMNIRKISITQKALHRKAFCVISRVYVLLFLPNRNRIFMRLQAFEFSEYFNYRPDLLKSSFAYMLKSNFFHKRIY